MESECILSAFHWMECSVALMDTATLEAIYWVDDARRCPTGPMPRRCAPCCTGRCKRFDRQLLHAAVVGTEHGGVLITGKGGIGKSTTALLCLEAGLTYLGDDYVIVALDPVPYAYSLYSTAKLNEDQAEQLPGLQKLRKPSIGPRDHAEPEKAVFQLYPDWRGSIGYRIPLRAILLPVISDQEATSFGAAGAYATQRSAAFTTLSHLPRAGRWSQTFHNSDVRGSAKLRTPAGPRPARYPTGDQGISGRRSGTAGASASRAGVTPLISVIIPVFNGVTFLAGAVRSILAQDYPSLDIIIIDDGSTEDIAGAVRTLPVEVRLFRRANSGPAAARNFGIREATGEFLAFLDV